MPAPRATRIATRPGRRARSRAGAAPRRGRRTGASWSRRRGGASRAPTRGWLRRRAPTTTRPSCARPRSRFCAAPRPRRAARRSSRGPRTRTVWCAWGRCARSRARAPSSGSRSAAPLLGDPLLAIRTEAARLLAARAARRAGRRRRRGAREPRSPSTAPRRRSTPTGRSRASISATWPLDRGDVATAEQEYRAAIRIDPTFTPAHVNLADVLRATGRDEEAAAILRAAIERDPASTTAPPRSIMRSASRWCVWDGTTRRWSSSSAPPRSRARRAALRLRPRSGAPLDREERSGGGAARSRASPVARRRRGAGRAGVDRARARQREERARLRAPARRARPERCRSASASARAREKRTLARQI